MTDAEKYDIWWDGYIAGVVDQESCTHKLGKLSRLVSKVTGGRISGMWYDQGDCALYQAVCPYDPDSKEIEGESS